MDRVFLDANVLFSAVDREDAPLQRLWRVSGTELYTSRYALAEARINLASGEPRKRLDELARSLTIAPEPFPGRRLPPGVQLPLKDRPILLAAIACQATHLLTGDSTHFGAYYGSRVEGVRIIPPALYLRKEI